jgi:hypothetical protein
MINLFAGRPKPDIEHVERIKCWARVAWHVPEDATVMVTELECREPDCPPIETVVAVLQEGEPTRRFPIFRSTHAWRRSSSWKSAELISCLPREWCTFPPIMRTIGAKWTPSSECPSPRLFALLYGSHESRSLYHRLWIRGCGHHCIAHRLFALQDGRFSG